MMNKIRLTLRSVFLRRRLEREMRQEMQGHIEESTQRLIARGLTPEEARRAAVREFGNVDYLQEEARDARGSRWVETTLADVRFGLRHFGKTPISTITMIALLALGIGFNGGLFTLLYSIQTMPPHGIEPDKSLVRIRGLNFDRDAGRMRGRAFSYPEYRDYAEQKHLFSAVAAWTSSDIVLNSGSSRETLQSGNAAYVTGDYFRVLGVRPIMGAGLPAATQDNGDPQLVAVISYGVWERMFAQAADVIGRTITVNDVAVAIVGVAPRLFTGTSSSGDQMWVWLPLNALPVVQHTTSGALSHSDSRLFGLAARLQPGIKPEHTLPTVQTIASRAAQQGSRWRAAADEVSTDVVVLQDDNYNPPSGEPELFTRFFVVFLPLLILLIPCTNVSALLVGHATRRRREIAIRLSLGARRGRIIRQLVTESVLLALAAGALSLFVLWVLLELIAYRVPEIQLALRWPVVAFTMGIALTAGILFGTSPALHATRLSVSEVLKNASNSVASTRSRLQSGLVVTQIALTQPLLVAFATMILSIFTTLSQLPVPLFNDRILRVEFNVNNRDSAVARQQMLALEQRFAAVPGVESVVPEADYPVYATVAVHPADQIPGRPYSDVLLAGLGAAPGYFELMGFTFVRGRDFDQANRDDGRAVIIRSDLARNLWGDADPIGRRLVGAGGSVDFVVVGVLDEKRAGVSGSGDVNVFVPKLSNYLGFLVRTSTPAENFAGTIRSVAHEHAPQLPVTQVRTLASVEAEQSLQVRRILAGIIGGGALALALAAIGLYAVISFAVNQRAREIGIRAALGADARKVVGLFFSRGMRLSLFGLVPGLLISVLVVRLITFDVTGELGATAFVMAGLIALTVISVGAVATWIPARRAARLDPLMALRTE
jgi:predicted permease